MHNLGQTRSSQQRDHFLQTPDTFVRASLPGMQAAVAIVHAAPAHGAGFSQYTAEMQTGGLLGPSPTQRFIYVLEGSLTVDCGHAVHKLRAGGFAYLPHEFSHEVIADQECRVAVIEKPEEPLEGINGPGFIVGHEESIAPQPLMGDTGVQVRVLVPDRPEYDFAVNTMTFEPGAALSMVEMHVMEHGLLMLAGGGIYRLGDHWYPVTKGDFIWMAPFCPQWFGALGKSAARYLIYKDWNRHPLR